VKLNYGVINKINNNFKKTIFYEKAIIDYNSAVFVFICGDTPQCSNYFKPNINETGGQKMV
jgi:hypothetical protein